MAIPKRVLGAAVAVAGLLAVACGGGSGQSTECSRYLSCVTALGGSTASLDSTYGASGSCWVDSPAAAKCTSYCKSALAAFPSDAGC